MRSLRSNWSMMAARREGPLIRGGNSNSGLSCGSRIAIAIAIGIAVGCVFAFFFPDGLFDSNLPSQDQTSIKSRQVTLGPCESSERTNMLKSELASLSEKNAELKKQVRDLNLKLQLDEQGKDQAQKQFLSLGQQHKAGPFGTVKAIRTNPTVVPDNSVNPRLAEILKKVAVKNELILAVANSNVKEMLKFWFDDIKRAGIPNYLAVSLDDDEKICNSNDVPVYRRSLDEGFDSIARTGGNHAVSGLKFRILREFLQLGNMTAYGFNDVYDEPKMGWARYAHTMRIWVYNSGFFYLRPTISSIELLDRVADRLAHEPVSGDQAVFNEKLFYPSHPGHDGLHASKRTMDMYLFMNNKVLKTVRKDAELSKLKPVIVHVNYHPDKLFRMKTVVEFYVDGMKMP